MDLEFGCFSQFFSRNGLFVDESGLAYNSCEQFMMASKARVFNDTISLKKIMKEKNPSRIKRLGRKVVGFEIETWDFLKYDIVLSGNRLKFNQNVELRRVLEATKGRMLVEAAENDRVWGIGVSVENAKKGMKWNGLNLLGKVLMEVRDE